MEEFLDTFDDTIAVSRRDIVDAFSTVTGNIVARMEEQGESKQTLQRMCYIFGLAGMGLLVELFDKEEEI